MPGATTRANEAGNQMGMAIIEMVHLMYQNQTALAFLAGLVFRLDVEIRRRENERKKDLEKPDG